MPALLPPIATSPIVRIIVMVIVRVVAGSAAGARVRWSQAHRPWSGSQGKPDGINPKGEEERDMRKRAFLAAAVLVVAVAGIAFMARPITVAHAARTSHY